MDFLNCIAPSIYYAIALLNLCLISSSSNPELQAIVCLAAIGMGIRQEYVNAKSEPKKG